MEEEITELIANTGKEVLEALVAQPERLIVNSKLIENSNDETSISLQNNIFKAGYEPEHTTSKETISYRLYSNLNSDF
jgi:hypothetical protein